MLIRDPKFDYDAFVEAVLEGKAIPGKIISRWYCDDREEWFYAIDMGKGVYPESVIRIRG